MSVATKQEEDVSIQISKLHGHKGSVLCLDFNENDDNNETSNSTASSSSSSLLLSGSEDCTARLWDIRDESTKRRASLCIRSHGEVLSVAFSPREPINNNNMGNPSTVDGKTELSSPFSKDHTVYLTVEQNVYEYDLRKATGPIIQEYTSNLTGILQNQDEVNQLALAWYSKPSSQSNKGKRKGKSGSGGGKKREQTWSPPSLYIAAADDAGTVRFMETKTDKSQILHHDTNGVAVVPTCTFRPSPSSSFSSKRGLELASGGTDCRIHLWDLLKPKRPISSYTIQMPESGDSNKPQVCNPPMVHSLAWSPSGKLLAAGLGDGNIPIFSIDNRNLVQTGFLPDGHESSVASILFPAFTAHRNERILCSGGSDGAILFWDLGADTLSFEQSGNDKSTLNNSTPNHLFPAKLLGETTPDDSSTENNDGTAVKNDDVTSDLSALSMIDTKPRILFGIPHGSKTNWITSSKYYHSIFVADTSNDITSYTIPMR